MGKKHKKKFKNSKWSDSNKKKKSRKRKYVNQKEAMLSLIHPAMLDYWFGNDAEQRDSFAEFLIDQNHVDDILDGTSMTFNPLTNKYQDKLDKITNKPFKNSETVLDRLTKVAKLEAKIDKIEKYNRFRSKKDLSLASYVNPKKYSKKLLGKSKYKKELNKIAKMEKAEMKEMVKLGIIKPSDDKSLDKDLSKLNAINNMWISALSDDYSQKHFID